VIGDRFAPVLRELRPLSDRFRAAGHRLFLVGGTVRDLVLGLDGDEALDRFDIDATTTARPDEIKQCLAGWADAVWTQGERFGTIGAMKRVPSATTGSTIERVYEITTHRAEAYENHSRKPQVQFSHDIEADLSRRDFTVNAMAIELTELREGEEPPLVDPFGGMRDLAARVLRTPLAPETSFSDDPLRMLRAARFIARYDLRPEPELEVAVRAMAERMAIVSAERVHDELDKLLRASRPAAGLGFAARTGLLHHIAPELLAAEGAPDAGGCHPHALEHALAVVDAAPVEPSTDAAPATVLRWAALLTPLGADPARRRMKQLRCSNDLVMGASRLIELAPPVVAALDAGSSWTEPELRRFAHAAGGLRAAVLAIAAAEAHARGPGGVTLARSLERFERQLHDLDRREGLDALVPQLSGDQVMEVLGIPAGRDVGEALAFLLDLRLSAGPVPEPELTAALRSWWSDRLRGVDPAPG
jgi:poly(A) polymerase